MANHLIGIAELAVAKAPDTITTLGLGSCIGLVMYDPVNKIGGMAHVMLPSSTSDLEFKSKAKYADTAFVELLGKVTGSGASRYKLVAKLAGGAHMFVSSVNNDIMKVGQRNIDMCKKLLMEHSIPLVAEDTGGNVGRTIEFDCGTGALKVRTAWPKTEKTI
jgi:chemotaxis protein CheD